ncbi:CMP-N-acetylneuraminate-beta-galactosamide-alpha-2, 3-sialyltransferase 1 [Dorcoceras hygrometricum]|uniref:CMP-N-acetylneuraminate-beta-galactosamide-alpha-2, 3-sialyltransferase 1 n=1 Tax=Dorcoceras hygrometricum TaxID=472368 RepID=A0A2Z7AZQ8_9LAMI|nr:CMP-N-acetylneuraminate-beta-galactosamide-alpha-2, 3-sialyltransferase 1 [Dorcoceras hygrometricum]
MKALRKPSSRRPPILHLLCISAAIFSLVAFATYSSFFSAGNHQLNSVAIKTLSDFQSTVQQCVANRGLGLTAHIIDHCNLVLKFPEGTNSTWYNEQFKIFEPLEYKYDVCEAILLWEQYRSMTTVLTREYLDARPDGWLDYAPKRIAQLGANKCYNKTLCEEHLNVLLPATPPFHPRQFKTCAVVGNSGDLLKTEFGEEIDIHDAVIRDNEAPVNDKYAKFVGLKRDFRLVVRGAARNMIPILKGSDDEVLIIKSLTHRDFNTMIKASIVLRRGAKGTGMKSIELALSMCDIVDIYGFTVDPGYTEWTRYFSSPRKGHNPLQGRAYYQLLECLGVSRLIHSPMRAERKEDWSNIPSRETISRAHSAAVCLEKKYQDCQDGGSMGQFRNCKVWGDAGPYGRGPVSGSADMSDTRRNSNYSKWETMEFTELRKAAQDQLIQMGNVSLYKMDGNKLDDLVCYLRMIENARVRRLRKEYRALCTTLAYACKEPVSHVVARPLPNDIFEWHYVLEGSDGTPFAGGYYYGKIKFPPEYPLKPPDISSNFPVLVTQFSSYSILTGFLYFMMETTPTFGSDTTTAEDKRRLAKSSLEFNCKNQTFKKLFPEYVVKYEDQLAAQQSVEQATPALIKTENCGPSLRKRGAKEEPSDVKSPQKLNSRNVSRQSFATWLLLLLVLIFGSLMALPLLQLW